MKKPPYGVTLVMEAVTKLLGVKPARYRDPKTGSYIDDYWMAAISKQVLGDSKLLDKLLHFKHDRVKAELLHTIEQYINLEEFHPKVVERSSVAAKSMSLWVRAMIDYIHVLREIEPK
jgi:dynein heavy chain